MTIMEFLGIGIALVLAITLHEASHGIVAYFLGDDTAQRDGRVTLNPLAHIDPIGTILLPGALLMVGAPFLFGYAKPVPVNFKRLRFGRFGVALVAGAGPLINLILALGSAFLLHINGEASTLGNDILIHSIRINIMLAIFNLLPLLPLDGGRVLHAGCPKPLQGMMENIEKYTFLILIGCTFVPLLTQQLLGYPIDILRGILLPPYQFLLKLILTLSGHSF